MRPASTRSTNGPTPCAPGACSRDGTRGGRAAHAGHPDGPSWYEGILPLPGHCPARGGGGGPREMRRPCLAGPSIDNCPLARVGARRRRARGPPRTTNHAPHRPAPARHLVALAPQCKQASTAEAPLVVQLAARLPLTQLVVTSCHASFRQARLVASREPARALGALLPTWTAMQGTLPAPSASTASGTFCRIIPAQYIKMTCNGRVHLVTRCYEQVQYRHYLY